ncbi:hypothetical protein [Desulfobacca acetoxidans]|uniref:PEP motif anchor domain protein n=1 Tax=Desulfobacca acetoxidans (strain ATCC 700848 / DSM 11109 / ASRB2) TaxID=880072 RepID=F2NF96_DESAR|nr:hypothetical protein [Desulfobacca acetoxidans]AEB08651.1 hypothetical protein Desac_0772 [Desulfobacca acetoxidans DSM 11109]
MKKYLSIILVLLAVAMAAGPAQSFTFNDIDFWVGSGSNRAALVVQWFDPRMENALVWGYRWDGEASGEDMMTAIAGACDIRSSNNGAVVYTTTGADSRLGAQLTTWSGFGGDKTLFGIGYDLDNDGGFAYVNGADETGHAADADDLYFEGWYNGFWSYWVEDDGDNIIGNNMTFSNWGMSARTLSNGSIDLWGWDDDLDSFFGGGDGIGQPVGPYAAATAPVPIPGAVLLLSTGLLRLAGMRRRREWVAGQ